MKICSSLDTDPSKQSLSPPTSSPARVHAECVGSCKQLSPSTYYQVVLTGGSMREFTPPSFPIYMYDRDGEYKITTIGEVSFFSFFSAESIDNRFCSFCRTRLDLMI